MKWLSDFQPYNKRPESSFPRSGTNGTEQVRFVSIFGGTCVEIFFDHEGYLEHDSVLKLTEVKTGELLDFFKTVHQRVAVYEQLARGLGDVEVVLEETLDRDQSLLIQTLD